MWNESNKDLMNSLTMSPLLAQSGLTHRPMSAKSEKRTLPVVTITNLRSSILKE
jgi:hypothetical protein